MALFNINEHQHIRYNPLKGEWILVSPHRMLRPWSGQVEPDPSNNHQIPDHDPTNPLCPGVKRASGIVTPNYQSTFVFTNDFPALLEDGPSPNTDGHDPSTSADPLFKMAAAKGTCRVMCFHPKTSKQIPTMELNDIQNIIQEWIRQLKDLGAKYNWVQIFENKGAIMGCSNPHPHCQIWASSFMPNEPRIKDSYLKQYYCEHGRPLLMDYVEKEIKKQERIVCENIEWIVVVPFWAIWPFETMILPKRQIQRFTDLNDIQQIELAKIMKEICSKYDNLFKCSFPYSMGWHGAPTGPNYLTQDMSHWTFHGMYYPPLLRSATVKKFMVGYEMLANSQRDLTPEKAAIMLRQQSSIHYTQQ